ncbi:hypothetical protein [Bradyrhizobium sp.]|uniref:hypothetical protein n=1 Tax=Bradyrhizobium sp. TaxID=376 RepID=UPI0039C86266
MDNATCCIDHEQRGLDALERVGQGGHLHFLLSDGFGNRNGGAEMRTEPSHAFECRFVGDALVLVPGDRDGGKAGGRFLDNRMDRIDIGLGASPLGMQPRREILLVRYHRRNSHDLSNSRTHHRNDGRVELRVFLQIQTRIFRIIVPRIKELPGFLFDIV